jgi:excisionase family DNA binding protein
MSGFVRVRLPGTAPENDGATMNTPRAMRFQQRGANVVPRLLAIKQVAYELGISRTSIYALIASRALKTVKIGRRRFVTIEAIEQFIAGLGK